MAKKSKAAVAHRSMQTSTAARCLLILAGMFAAPVAAHADEGFGAEIELEVHLGKGDDHLLLDSTFTAGAGSNQFVVKVEGGSDTRTAFDDVEIQALYSRKLSDSVAILGGVRHDFRKGPGLTHGSLAIEAELAPWLEGEHYLFLSEHGDLTGSGQLIANWKLTSRLTLEPRLAFGWSGQDIPGEALASGFTDIESSVRLRYALGQNLDVYVGVIHERLLGGTRAAATASGDPAKVTRAVIGAGYSF